VIPVLAHHCRSLFDALLPVRCAACTLPGDHICHRCRAALKAAPLVWRRTRGALPPVFALGTYAGTLRTAVLNVKFRNRRDAARQLGDILGRKLCVSFDALVPVPLHSQRLAARGFNQAAVIAAGIGGVLHLPVIEALERCRQTEPQSALERRRRLANVAHAFVPTAAAQALHAARILLVDDVVTTGATIASCARVLRAGGVQTISAAALALKK
jgi:ComF family protein